MNSNRLYMVMSFVKRLSAENWLLACIHWSNLINSHVRCFFLTNFCWFSKLRRLLMKKFSSGSSEWSCLWSLHCFSSSIPREGVFIVFRQKSCSERSQVVYRFLDTYVHLIVPIQRVVLLFARVLFGNFFTAHRVKVTNILFY